MTTTKICSIYKTTTDGVEHYLCDRCGSDFPIEETPVCDVERTIPSPMPVGKPANEQTVRDIVTRTDWDLEKDVLDLPVDSVVGEGCKEIIVAAEALLNAGAEDGGWEDDYQARVLRAVEAQCNVWLFG